VVKGSALRGFIPPVPDHIKKLIMKKLYRGHDEIFAGICDGLGEFSEIDPTIIRLIFAGLIFTPFPIITCYIIAWIVIPKKYYE